MTGWPQDLSEGISYQEALSVLAGKCLHFWWSTANMIVTNLDKIDRCKNKSREEFAIHIQFPWFVLRRGGKFIKLSDLYSLSQQIPEFDWDKWGSYASWPDYLSESQMQYVLKDRYPTTRSPENISDYFVALKGIASILEDTTIHLSGVYVLELSSNGVDEKHWQFHDKNHKKHFVVENIKKGVASN